MSISIQNPRLYTNAQGQTYPAVSDVAHGSYCTQGYHPPAGPDEDINLDIAAGKVVPEAATVLARAGWDGAPLSTTDRVDLMRFADFNGSSFAYNIHMAYYAMWQARGDFVMTSAPQPTPPPPTSSGVQGSELYESGHEISQKLPKGTKIRRGVGCLETAWGGLNAMIAQAQVDGVPDSADVLKGARDGLLGFFYALNSAFQEGRDWLMPNETAEVQLSCDQVWNVVHQARKLAAAAKQDGWQLVANDPRSPVYKYSRHNRIAWTALSNLTGAAGLYGMLGELQANGTRAAEYVDAFEPWDSQDPNIDRTEGSGGINVPGPHLSDAAISTAQKDVEKNG